MKTPSPGAVSFTSTSADRISRAALSLAVCLVALVLLPPWVPVMPHAGLDPSWAVALGHAYKEHWQFGKDVVFTFGPFGFAFSNLFDPATYATTLSIWIATAITLSIGFVLIARRLPAWQFGVLAILMLGGLRASANANDPVFLLVPLLLVLLPSYLDERASRVAMPLLCAMVALVGLIKFTFWTFGFAAVLLLELGRLATRRRLPVYLLAYVLSSLLFFALAGQSVANYPAFLTGSLAVMSGYSESMQLFGRAPEILLYVAIGASFTGIAARNAWQGARRRQAAPSEVVAPLVLGLFVFMAFKAGFVRHDQPHALLAWSSLSAGLALYAAYLMTRLPAKRMRAIVLGLCVCAAVVAVHRHLGFGGASVFAGGGRGPSFSDRVRAIASAAAGGRTAQLAAEHDAALAEVRAKVPMPDIAGTVDIYPWNASAVLAHGLDYRPRPVFQSFAVYNDLLMSLNREHLEGPSAPSTLIFGLYTIDGRLLSQDEGPLWPTLASRYEVASLHSDYAVLRRRALPGTVEWQPRGDTQVTWAQDLPVPRSTRPVFVQIDVGKTLFGRLADLAFKLPVVELVLTFDDDRERSFRVVPTIARHGFLLSPFISTVEEWSQVMADGPRRDSAAPSVVKMRINKPKPTLMAIAYRDELRVTFRELSFATPP